MEIDLSCVDREALVWRKVRAEGLDMDYTRLLPGELAHQLMAALEQLEYFTGDLARVRVYGKWHPIPRQHVTFGDPGLTYKFSGNTVPARPWPPAVRALRDLLARVTGHTFNFVLVNRYRHGGDHMGEHRDDEEELDPESPIASVSLGQARDFVLRHSDARKSGPAKRDVPKVKVLLEHGSLLMMNPPTNKLWYHSLPQRKSCPGVRINLTFRKFLLQRS